MTRAHRMKRVSSEAGLGRESLYKSRRAGAGPEFNTLLRVLRTLVFRLQVHPAFRQPRQVRRLNPTSFDE